MTPDTFASPTYRTTLRRQYEQPGWGSSGYSHARTVLSWACELGARTALDYGCGRGTLAPVVPELSWSEYDPGIAGKDALPQPADLLVCTDVLEHVEPDRIGAVLAHVRGLARLGMFLTIALSPAKLTLPDGRNAHLIVRTREWWQGELSDAGIRPERSSVPKGLWIWARTCTS